MPGNRARTVAASKCDRSRYTFGCRVRSIWVTIARLTTSRGRQLAARVVLFHEAHAVAVDQPGSLAAHGFGDQAAAAAGDVQHGGMKLHELHVAQFGPGAITRSPIRRRWRPRDSWFRGRSGPCRRYTESFAWPRPAPCRARRPHQRSAATFFVGQQIEGEGVFPGLHVFERAGAIDHGPHHFLAGGVAQGVYDAMVAMPALASQGQSAGFLIEIGSPIDQLLNSRRRLANDHLDDIGVAQSAAGR